MMTCTHHYRIIQSSLTALKPPRTLPIHPSLPPPLKPLAPLILFLLSLCLCSFVYDLFIMNTLIVVNLG